MDSFDIPLLNKATMPRNTSNMEMLKKIAKKIKQRLDKNAQDKIESKNE